jgi:hypothetical protein
VAGDYYKRGTLLAGEYVRMQAGAQPLTAWQNIKAHRVSLLVKNGLLFAFIGGGLWVMSYLPQTPPPPGWPGFMRYIAQYSGLCFGAMGLFIAWLDVWNAATTHAWDPAKLASRNAAQVRKLDHASKQAILQELQLDAQDRGAFFVD